MGTELLSAVWSEAVSSERLSNTLGAFRGAARGTLKGPSLLDRLSKTFGAFLGAARGIRSGALGEADGAGVFAGFFISPFPRPPVGVSIPTTVYGKLASEAWNDDVSVDEEWAPVASGAFRLMPRVPTVGRGGRPRMLLGATDLPVDTILFPPLEE